MNIIVMTDREGCIGVNGDQVLHLHNDLVRFQEYTKNKIVVCGAKTVKTFPNQLPLKDRSTIILSRTLDNNEYIKCTDRNVIICDDVRDIIMLPAYVNTSDIWIIGGASIYRQLIRFVDRIILTEVDTVFTGDNKLYFPADIQYDFEKYDETLIEDYDRNDILQSIRKKYNTKLIEYRRRYN